MAHTHLLDYMPSGHFLGPSAVTQHTGVSVVLLQRHVRTIELNQDSSTQVLKYQRVNRESPSGKRSFVTFCRWCLFWHQT